jgi:hypothetical protein
MARSSSNDSFTVVCPCCQTTLTIDPELKTVLHHQAPAKAPVIDDLAAAAKRLGGEAAKREAAFQKSFDDLKAKGSVMDRKFDELLKQAKNTPGTEPPKKLWD